MCIIHWNDSITVKLMAFIWFFQFYVNGLFVTEINFYGLVYNEFSYSIWLQITVPSENRTDDDKIYQRITLQELQKAAPAINWITYFKEAFDQIEYNITENELVGVYSIEYLQRLSDLVVEYNKTDEKRM